METTDLVKIYFPPCSEAAWEHFRVASAFASLRRSLRESISRRDPASAAHRGQKRRVAYPAPNKTRKPPGNTFGWRQLLQGFVAIFGNVSPAGVRRTPHIGAKSKERSTQRQTKQGSHRDAKCQNQKGSEFECRDGGLAYATIAAERSNYANGEYRVT